METMFRRILLVGAVISCCSVFCGNNNNNVFFVRGAAAEEDEETAPANVKIDMSETWPPLIVSAVAVQPVPGRDGIVSFSTFSDFGETAHFLYDVQRTTQRQQGQPVYYAKVASEADVERVLQEHNADNILLAIHGFSASPTDAMRGVQSYNKRPDRQYLAVPVIWDTSESLATYATDRRDLAPEAGEALLGLLQDIIDDAAFVSRRLSIMCHSMGNYVLRACAQMRPDNAAPVFDDIFMVAADVREDIFDTLANDYPEDRNKGNSCSIDEFDQHVKNPGLDIASLAKRKVHVLWSRGDTALMVSHLTKLFQQGRREKGKKIMNRITNRALGAHGRDRKIKTHPTLQGKVVYHDCGRFNWGFPAFHGYHWAEGAIKIYENALLDEDE